ncbi:cytoskeletal protein-binding protein SLA1 [Aspergillus undulatus]|uniref:cytoskeletal protein-binding protein SLA1 n=1 Tax=Aspergillus undulatus TaxID=1810928 RepID=UPI003CCD1056
MGFIGVYSAIYDYQPQAHGELELREGDLLYILEKSAEDDWWKAKKKADRDDEDEPEGLVPNNYVEEAQPIHTAKALYDYTRQTDEEVSFSEDESLVVYDTSDPDWTLVGVHTDFGFAPSNYIEIIEGSVAQPAQASASPEPYPPAVAPVSIPAAPSLPQRPEPEPTEEANAPIASSPSETAPDNAAAAIASIIHRNHPGTQSPRDVPPPPQPPSEPAYREPSPPPPQLPRRPPSEALASPVHLESPRSPSPVRHPRHASIQNDGGPRESPPYNRVGRTAPRSPSGYHMYNINEMVEVMGKRKKMPTTLGINIATGTIFISPEDDGDTQEWTAEKLSHYSIEGKHVFIDLVRPSKSVDFHAGAKDTAREIVSALGEISGAFRAEGLREVIAASAGGGSTQKKGNILYDFMAQGDDEVTVGVGDEVVILDDSKSEEWWMVRRIKNGKEGVVPSSYVEVSGFVSPPPAENPIESGLSSVERNRLEEARLAKEATQKSVSETESRRSSQHHKKDSKSSQRSKPDPTKVRTWIDRSKAFTVEAQFIGLQDGKIHLHKTNGIKIAVPIPKMSFDDLEYVEKVTGVSLDEDKPLSDIQRQRRSQVEKADKARESRAGAGFQQSDYDWFDFFLKAGVGPHQCERYAQNFAKDSMDEGILPDISPETLRTLGLKEGDILRVMRYLDNMFGRTGGKAKNVSFGGEQVMGNGEDAGGLFAGRGGRLHNNTRKGRPAPAVQTNDVVDPKVFEQKDETKPAETPKSSTPPPAAVDEKPVQKGFDDDAWAVKTPAQAPAAAPAVAPAASSQPPAAASAPASQAPSAAMADLSLLQAPLQPTPAQPAPTPAQSPPVAQPIVSQPTAVPAPQPQQPQQTGATPNFFTQIAQVGQHQARQRPQAPQVMGQNSLIPPPPQRPLSAPQNLPQQQPFGVPQLQPQLTGLPQQGPQMAAPGQNFQPQFQPQQTGFMGPNQFQNGLMPQPTGFQPQSQFGIQQQQQQQTGFQSLAPQPTGFGGFQAPQQQPMATGINSALPPALQPQPTGMNGSGSMGYSPSPPPIPPIPQQHTITPLQAQKTGPAPPIRFGVKPDGPKKLAPQPTGMKANLSQATPTNPFGF